MRCCWPASGSMPVRTLETGYAFRHPLLRGALAEVVDKRPRDEAAAAATTG